MEPPIHWSQLRYVGSGFISTVGDDGETFEDDQQNCFWHHVLQVKEVRMTDETSVNVLVEGCDQQEYWYGPFEAKVDPTKDGWFHSYAWRIPAKYLFKSVRMVDKRFYLYMFVYLRHLIICLDVQKHNTCSCGRLESFIYKVLPLLEEKDQRETSDGDGSDDSD